MDDKTYIFEGKTSTEAIEKGLKELKTNKNKVDIKILEEENKKTFFSILDKKVVKVEIKFKESVLNQEQKEPLNLDETIKDLDKFISKFISKLPTKDLDYEITKEKGIIKINIKDERAAYLIGYRGETLNALQTILINIASNDKKEKVRLLLDISNYREKRSEDLKRLADKIAESVIKTKKSVTLEPMIAYERKIIHTQLQDSEKVKTHSIGNEPNRKIVISLK